MGRRLRERPPELEWNQEQAAEAAGIHAKYLRRVETGDANPTFAVIVALSVAYEISLDQLFRATWPASSRRAGCAGQRRRTAPEEVAMFFECVGVLLDLERPHGDVVSAAAHLALANPLTIDLIALVPEPTAPPHAGDAVDERLRCLVEARLREAENELHARSDVEVTTKVVVTTAFYGEDCLGGIMRLWSSAALRSAPRTSHPSRALRRPAVSMAIGKRANLTGCGEPGPTELAR